MQYHQFQILCHRPYISRRYLQPQQPPQGPGPSHARKSCLNAAVSIAQILLLYEKTYTFHRGNVQVISYIFSAALILIFSTVPASTPTRSAPSVLRAGLREGLRPGYPNQETIPVDTSKILFICGGAFAGLDKIVDARTNKQGSIGFGAELKNDIERIELTELFKQVEPEDLVKFGIIPELVGRLPIITPLAELDESALVQILTEPKNAIIKQYQALFKMEGVELKFTKDALSAIAQKAISRKTGARGLRSIVENLLLDTMYDLPSLNAKKVTIGKGCVEKGEKPKVE